MPKGSDKEKKPKLPRDLSKPVVNLKNGAQGAHFINENGKSVFRIIKGVAPKGSQEASDAMNTLRSKRGVKKSAAMAARPSLRDAQKAFDKHFDKAYMENPARRARHAAAIAKKNPGLTPRQLTIRTNESLRKQRDLAKQRDRNHVLPPDRVINDGRYLENNGPAKYDFRNAQGSVDAHGVRKPRSAAQRAHDAVLSGKKKKKAELSPAAKAMERMFAANRTNQTKRPQKKNNPVATRPALSRSPSMDSLEIPEPIRKQRGGQKPVSLKTAVQLLREYYRTAY